MINPAHIGFASLKIFKTLFILIVLVKHLFSLSENIAWIIFAVYVAILQCTHNYSGSRLLVGPVAYGV